MTAVLPHIPDVFAALCAALDTIYRHAFAATIRSIVR